jgi:hypothetical protein
MHSMLTFKQFLPKFKIAPAILLILIGLLGLVPITWFKPHQQLFGILAVAPIINLVYIGAGLALAGRSYFNRTQASSWIYRRFKQAIGVVFGLLAIGGFLSLPFWPGLWLNTMANTLGSDILYTLSAIYFLYQAFWSSSPQVVENPVNVIN